jgi:transcriptional regulator with GAF, ATPase, and Fis domain
MLATNEVFPEEWLQLAENVQHGPSQPSTTPGADLLHLPLDGSMSLDEVESVLIRRVLERSRFNVAAAARALGITRQTLRYRIEKHGIKTS